MNRAKKVQIGADTDIGMNSTVFVLCEMCRDASLPMLTSFVNIHFMGSLLSIIVFATASP